VEEKRQKSGKAWKMERVCECAESTMESRSIVQMTPGCLNSSRSESI